MAMKRAVTFGARPHVAKRFERQRSTKVATMPTEEANSGSEPTRRKPSTAHRPHLDCLDVVYCSDVFLENRRLRASLALLYDEIQLPPPPGSQNCLGEWETYKCWIAEIEKADGQLGKERVIRRDEPKTDILHLYAPEWLCLIRYMESDPAQNACHPQGIERFMSQCPPGFIAFFRGLWRRIKPRFLALREGAATYAVKQLANFFNHVWSRSVVPRFFYGDEIYSVPIAVEDLEALMHDSILGHFLPHVGDLRDDEILYLRERTSADRLGYAARLLELVGDCERAIPQTNMADIRRFLMDRTKTSIIPAFVEYAASLEGQRRVKPARFGRRAVDAVLIDANICSPKYWMLALKSLLSWNAEEKEAAIGDIANDRHFFAFLNNISLSRSLSGTRRMRP